MENPGARARKATWNQPLRGGLWIFRGPNFERYGPEAYCIIVLDLPGLLPLRGLLRGTAPSGAWVSYFNSLGPVTDASTESHRAVTIHLGPNHFVLLIYFKIKLK